MLERIDNDEEIIAEKAIKIDIKKPKIKIDEMMLSKDDGVLLEIIDKSENQNQKVALVGTQGTDLCSVDPFRGGSDLTNPHPQIPGPKVHPQTNHL